MEVRARAISLPASSLVRSLSHVGPSQPSHVETARSYARTDWPHVAQSKGTPPYLFLPPSFLTTYDRSASVLHSSYMHLSRYSPSTHFVPVPLYIDRVSVVSLEVTVWVVPSLIENAVAVALVGMLLGPMYPILMNHTTKILPRWLLTGAMGYIAGVGQAGSAVLPFLTGILASKFGISSLQPL